METPAVVDFQIGEEMALRKTLLWIFPVLEPSQGRYPWTPALVSQLDTE